MTHEWAELEGVDPVPGCPNMAPLIADPTAIVIHYTGGGHYWNSSVKWFMDPASRVSAHFVVGRWGEVAQVVPLSMKAWHVGQSSLGGEDGVNDFSFGIEIANVGPVEKDGSSCFYQEGAERKRYPGEWGEPIWGSYQLGGASVFGYWEPYKDVQVAAVARLCAYLVTEFQIGTDRIVGHEDVCIPEGRKTDPGPLWDWSSFMKSLKKELGWEFVLGSRHRRRQ